jgi:hypothetical protein
MKYKKNHPIKDYILSHIFEIIDRNNADNTTMLLENFRDKLDYERIMYNDLINKINAMIKPENIIYHNKLTNEEKTQIDYQNDIIIQESIDESKKIMNTNEDKRTFEEYNKNAKNIMKIINEDKNKTFFLSQNKPDNFASGNLFSTNLVLFIKMANLTIPPLSYLPYSFIVFNCSESCLSCQPPCLIAF